MIRATFVLLLTTASAAAQDVPQLSAPTTTAVEQIAPDARPTMQQVTPKQTSRDLGQVARPEQSRAAPGQLSARDRNPRLAAIPAAMVDACDEAAQGKRPKPEGVDCASVLEAIAQPAPRRSAEEVLLLGGTEDGDPTRVGAQPLLVPNADQVAEQLRNGDVSNAPVAQAVGAGFQSPNGVTPGAGGAQTPTIIPGGSGGVVMLPGGVNP